MTLTNNLKSFEIRAFELLDRLKWFNRLRWLAIIGIFVVTEFVVLGLKIKIVKFPFYICILVLIIANISYSLVLKVINKLDIQTRLNKATILANFQIAFDLLILTILLYYSGGIDNPFSYYYVFHIVIASMLLKSSHCYFQTFLASILYSGLLLLQYNSLIPKYYIFETNLIPSNYELIRISGTIVAFVSTMFILAYITSSISERLRIKENLLLETNMKLVDLDVKKSEFVMMAAHELKSPLATIQFMLKTLKGGYIGVNLDEKVIEQVNKIETRISMLLKLVTDLLDLSKIKTGFGNREFKKVSLVPKLQKTIEFFNSQAKEMNIKMDVNILGDESDFIIDGDDEYLSNVFNNIISNAIKYSYKEGKVEIILKKENNEIIFICKDYGIGIPEKDLNLIFEEFHRTSISKKHTQFGSGVGLAITKKIIELHNGSITVNSEVGKGSEFIIKLPINKKNMV